MQSEKDNSKLRVSLIYLAFAIITFALIISVDVFNLKEFRYLIIISSLSTGLICIAYVKITKINHVNYMPSFIYFAIAIINFKIMHP